MASASRTSSWMAFPAFSHNRAMRNCSCASLLMLVVVAALYAWRRPPLSAPAHPDERPRNAWRQYYARYAVLVLAFVVFDMEMAFMYPWAVAFKRLGLTALWRYDRFRRDLGCRSVVSLAHRGTRAGMTTSLLVFALLWLGIALVQIIDAFGEGRGLRTLLAPLHVIRACLATRYDVPKLGHPVFRGDEKDTGSPYDLHLRMS